MWHFNKYYSKGGIKKWQAQLIILHFVSIYFTRTEKKNNRIDFRLTPTYSYMSFPKMKTEDCTQIWFNLCLCIQNCLQYSLLEYIFTYIFYTSMFIRTSYKLFALSVCLSVFLSFSLPLYLFISLSFFLSASLLSLYSICLGFTLSLCLSFSLYLCLSDSLPLCPLFSSLSLFLSFPLSHWLSVSLSPCLCVSLSLLLYICLSMMSVLCDNFIARQLVTPPPPPLHYTVYPLLYSRLKGQWQERLLLITYYYK